MSSFIISKREFLKGLFAAPALVAATSLMPIKPQAAGIFTLESFKEIPTYNSWSLVREQGGNYAWMKESDIASFINPLDIIKQVNMPLNTMYDFKGNHKLTIELMKISPAQVVHEIPGHFRKY